MIFVLWQNMIKFYHQLIEFRGIVPQTEQNKNIGDRKKWCWESEIDSPKRKVTATKLKILTPNKLLTRFPILLQQAKDGNSSYKLENIIRQILYLFHQHNKITKKIYKNLIKLL